MLFARIILALTAVMFGGHGAMCLIAPETIANESGLDLPSPGARTEARAMYGGLELALGLYFGVSALRQPQVSAALVVMAVTFSGLALARGFGLLLQDGTDLYNARALAYEGTSGILALTALFLVSRRAPSPPAA